MLAVAEWQRSQGGPVARYDDDETVGTQNQRTRFRTPVCLEYYVATACLIPITVSSYTRAGHGIVLLLSL